MKNGPEPARLAKTARVAECIVALVAALAYLNTLSNDFCYDDNPIVRDSALVNEPGKALDIWTTDYWGENVSGWKHRDLLYRPAAVASFRLVRTVFGPSPTPQHAGNVLLHTLVAVLILRLCRAAKVTEVKAITASLLFAVLPIHVEAVAPIVGRADLLAAAGTLIAILAQARAGDPHCTHRTLARAAMLVAIFLAMSSKETGVAAVPILILLGLRNTSKTAGSPILRRAAVLIIPLAVYLTLRYFALDGTLFQQPAPSKTINALIDAPAWQRILGVFQLFGMYWIKTLWPQTLCISYAVNAVRPATSFFDPTVLIGLAVFLALTAWSAIAWQRGNRTIAFLFTAMLLAYLPTANAFVLIQVFFAERIWYLPSIAACLLLSLAVGPLLEKSLWRTVGAVILAAMLIRGWTRSAEWKDNGTLYASCYRDHPESIACLNLYGGWLTAHGDPERGLDLLNRAVETDLGFTDAHRALGQAYLKQGDLDRAVQHLQTADMQVPHHPPTVESLARAVEQLRTRHAAQLAQLERATAQAPADVNAELDYIRTLRDLGLCTQALERFQTRGLDFGTVAKWHYEYAVTLVLLDQRDAAIERYKRAVELDTQNPQIGDELAMLLLERRGAGDPESAGDLCARAAALAPTDPAVHICQAEHHALIGQLDAARDAYRRAISLLPADNSQRRILEQRAKTLGG